MTEIYLHIVARMADYMDTHPYGSAMQAASGAVVLSQSISLQNASCMHDRLLLFHGNIRGLAVDSRAKLRVMALKKLVVY